MLANIHKNDTKQIRWISFALCFTYTFFLLCGQTKPLGPKTLGTAKKKNEEKKITTIKQNIDETIDNGPKPSLFIYTVLNAVH